MIKINLLPYRETRKKAGIKRQLYLMGVVLCVVCVCLLGMHIYLMAVRAELANKVRTAEAKIAALSRVAGEIDRVKGDRAVLEKKIGIIKNLEENRLKPVLILDDLTALIPSGQIWLVSLSSNENDLRVDGMARDNSAVAQFMKNLEHSTYYKSVDLISSKQSIIGSTKLQAFTVSCSYKRGL
jgi:type IV pilus assembly protein PilN